MSGASSEGLDIAFDFLREFHQGRPVHVCSIVPDGPIAAKSFGPEQNNQLREFLSAHNGRANLYFHVNELGEECVDRKAKKDDVAQAVAFHVDIDDLGQRSALEEFSPPPTVVVASGGGFNAYWLLNEPTTDFAYVEAINSYLVEELGGDAAAKDVSRILRVPGTINLPTRKKRERGREAVESSVLAELTSWDRRYSFSDFPDPPPTEGTGGANEGNLDDPKDGVSPLPLPAELSERLTIVATDGDDPDRPRYSPDPRYKSRSEAVFAVACGLARLGMSEEDIAGILINPELKISESILEKRDARAYALRQARQAIIRVGESWPDGENNQGIPRKTFQNTQAALLRTGCSFFYDVFRYRYMVNGAVVQRYEGELNDRVVLFLRDFVNKTFNFDPGQNFTRDSLEQLCASNPVDPVCEYLASLSWDCVNRVDTWLIDFASADDTPLNRAISRITLVAAVGRARQPGVKFDTIPVLEGPQGTGKSTLIRILASAEFYSDQDLLALDARSQIEALEGVWIYELGELAGMKHTDKNKIKSFVSRTHDRARAAYARYAETRPRRGIMIGSTNDDEYLKDETGNRRFWPVRTGDIDLEGLARVRHQLWAEAARLESLGEPIELHRDLWDAAEIEQTKRLESDGWEIILNEVEGEHQGEREIVTSRHLLTEYIKIENEKIQRYHWKRLKKAMNNVGWNGPITVTPTGGRPAKGFWRKSILDPDHPI